ncbi:MAG TPA: oligoendopeptidase F [Spirochaetota bacterium]|nr:oligoendopeptidase F [Spirochaetota bacterium]
MATGEGGNVPARHEVPREDAWNLTPLFENDDAWRALAEEIETVLPEYSRYRGGISSSADYLTEAIDFDLRISRLADRLYTYAHLKHDQDKTNQHYAAMNQRAMDIIRSIREASSFMEPEINAVPDEVMAEYMAGDALKEYRFYLHKILRKKAHTRSGEVEELLAMSGDVAAAPSQFFGQLNNADLRFGAIEDESGAQQELSHGNFITFLMKPDGDIRKRAFEQYYRVYDDHKHSIASSLVYSMKKDLFYARARGYRSTRDVSLFRDNMPDAVYDTLIESVRRGLPELFRYFGLRKRLLDVEELHFYDTYVPLVQDVRFHMPFEEAVDLCSAAVLPLGEEYSRTMKDGLMGGWVDRYENRGKRSGAYSSGCYDSPPYILMNYRPDSINSLYTLIHEAGHSMHTLLSNRAQPYMYHGYTIFAAEVASTCNEYLLSRHLLEKYRDNSSMTAYIVNREVDNIRGTLFRQTMFAEFEHRAHGTLQSGSPLTLDVLTGIYRALLDDYFGDAVVIDRELELECLRIPHFYSPFYVYKYATGISAALSLGEKIVQGGDADRQRYLDFLSMGGSAFPLEELRMAGVDMEGPEPVQDAVSYFGKLCERLESLIL